MGDINSLLRFRKLPVFLLGNSARKSLISQKVGKRSFVPRLRYPVFFPVTRESHFRDGGALEMLNPHMKSWGIYELYRQKAEKLLAEKERGEATPTKSYWAPGSLEWQAEQDKSS